jgi:hypothetical protein
VKYREINKITGLKGTAVNVQAMVYGNYNSGNGASGTGVLFTRNPATGENKLYGEFLMDAQGEDVVAGEGGGAVIFWGGSGDGAARLLWGGGGWPLGCIGPPLAPATRLPPARQRPGFNPHHPFPPHPSPRHPHPPAHC